MSRYFPIIRTGRLLLRQFGVMDLEHVFKGLSHPDVIQYYGVRYQTLEETKEQLKFFADLETTGSGIWWAVCSLDQTTFYGAGGLNSLNIAQKKAEIGFWLLPEFWGRGIMVEAMPLICAYGFENLGLESIEGFVETENNRCKRALSKLDFKFEGTKKTFEIKNGIAISLDTYVKINTK